MRFETLHPADQLVEMMNRIYYGGMTTVSGGNLSVRDGEGNIWITPTSVDKGGLTRGDICCVHPDGSVEGPYAPSVELPFHSHIYRIRPDIGAIVHAHPPALVGFSLARLVPDVELLPGLKGLCGGASMAAYDVPGSKQLGENIAKEFAKGYDTILMENHGLVIGKEDLQQAFRTFEAMEFLARTQIGASRLGKLIKPSCGTEQTLRPPFLETVNRGPAGVRERALRRDLCALLRRAYGQKLVSADFGEFSARVDGNSFLITPFGADRKLLEMEDLVLVRDGKCESGKTPDCHVRFHQALYEANADAQALFLARPSSAMAFAVSDAAFDARTIPESYIMLRFPLRLPYGSLLAEPERTARRLSLKTPVALVENDCLCAMGTTPLNAFDRIEVAEFSAASLLNCAAVGEAVKISDEEVRQIEKDFHLPV